MATVVVLHGVVDVGVTLLYRGAESNPVVLALGWHPWLIIKAFAIGAFVAITLLLLGDRRHQRALRWSATALVALGLVLILPNLWVIAR